MPDHDGQQGACALGTVTTFAYPSPSGAAGGIRLSIVEQMPPVDGAFMSMPMNALALHVGRPVPIRQRRDGVSRSWTFTRGDLTLIPAGCQTTSWTEKSADFLQIELDAELVRRAAGDPPTDVELPCLFSFEDPVCRELLPSMVAEAQAHGAAARMYVEFGALLLVQRILSRSRRPASMRRSGLPPSLLRRAKEFLHDRMNRNPGITELSAAVGMSADHFSRMFKRSTGLAPHQYLGDLRLERAKRLLADARTPIIEIAFEIGYANPSQFSAFFRKRTGLSPTEFRRTAGALAGGE
jgi:AraC family transcriptional regulator